MSCNRYEYFTCSGRRKKNGCTHSAIHAPRIEEHIETSYATNALTEHEAARVRAVLGTVFAQLEASSDDERAVLNSQKEKLDAERLKLVQAHYADAIPLDLLKSEQDRIRTNLDAIEARLSSLATTYSDARKGLDQVADILTNLGDLYSKCEPSERRMLNRALFSRIVIDEDEHPRYMPAEPAASVLTHARVAQSIEPETARNLPRDHAGQVSNFSTYVGPEGLEPPTLSV